MTLVRLHLAAIVGGAAALAAATLSGWICTEVQAGKVARAEKKLSDFQGEAAKAQAKAVADARAEERRARSITDTAETAAVVSQANLEAAGKTIIKRVPIYVTRKADAGCVVPVGAVRLFNDAIRNSGAAGQGGGAQAAAGAHGPAAKAVDAP